MLTVHRDGWVRRDRMPLVHLSFLGFDEHGHTVHANQPHSHVGWNLDITWPDWPDDPRIRGALSSLLELP